MALKSKQNETLAKEEEIKKSKYETVEGTFSDDDLDFPSEDINSEYLECYFVRMITKDAAYFKFSQKKGDKIIVDPRTTICDISGDVKKIELDSYTYEGKEVKTFKIHIEKKKGDGKILFILNSSFTTNTGRNILNTILGYTKKIEKITIGLYVKDGFPASKILINGERSKWYFSPEEQKQYIEIIVNKKGEKVSTDYSEYIDILEEKMREKLSVLFPDGNHIKFIEEDANDVLNTEVDPTDDEKIFGEKDPSNFFDDPDFDIDENK